MKSCKAFEKRLRGYISGELRAEENEEMKHHIDSCEACRGIYDKNLQVFRGLLEASRLEEGNFISSRSEILKRVDEGRYGKSPARRLGFAFAGNIKRYTLSAALIMVVFMGVYFFRGYLQDRGRIQHMPADIIDNPVTIRYDLSAPESAKWEKLASVRTGIYRDGIIYAEVPGDPPEIEGPEGFFVDRDGTVYVLNSAGNSVIIIKDGKTEALRIEATHNRLIDIYVEDGNIYLLHHENNSLGLLKMLKDGRNIGLAELNNKDFNERSHFEFIKDREHGLAILMDGKSIITFTSEEMIMKQPKQLGGIASNTNGDRFTLQNSSASQVTLKNLKTSKGINIQENSKSFTSQSILGINEETAFIKGIFLNPDSQVIDAADVLIKVNLKNPGIGYSKIGYTSYYKYPNKNIFIGEDFKPYVMVCEEKGVSIYRIDF